MATLYRDCVCDNCGEKVSPCVGVGPAVRVPGRGYEVDEVCAFCLPCCGATSVEEFEAKREANLRRLTENSDVD